MGDGSPRHQISTDYDGLGNKTREIDEAGVATSYTYDWRGLVTSVTLDAGSPNAIIWNYTYDESGNLLSQADPNGAVTQFAYDALGRRTQRRLADGSKEITSYADIGADVKVAQIAVTDWRNKTSVTTEDTLGGSPPNPGRPSTLARPPPSKPTATPVGGQVAQVLTTTNGATNRLTSYTYDDLNRLAKKDTPEGVLAYPGPPTATSQTINAYRRSLVAVNGPHHQRHDRRRQPWLRLRLPRRLAAATNATLGPTNVTTYAYDNVGNLAGFVYPNGARHSYRYNAQNRLTPRRSDQRQQHRPANLQLRPRRRRRPHQRRPVRRHKRDQNRHLRLRRAPPTPRPPPRLRELCQLPWRRLRRHQLRLRRQRQPHQPRRRLRFTPADTLTNQAFHSIGATSRPRHRPHNANTNTIPTATPWPAAASPATLFTTPKPPHHRPKLVSNHHHALRPRRQPRGQAAQQQPHLLSGGRPEPFRYAQVLAEFNNLSNAPSVFHTWA